MRFFLWRRRAFLRLSHSLYIFLWIFHRLLRGEIVMKDFLKSFLLHILYFTFLLGFPCWFITKSSSYSFVTVEKLYFLFKNCKACECFNSSKQSIMNECRYYFQMWEKSLSSLFIFLRSIENSISHITHDTSLYSL